MSKPISVKILVDPWASMFGDDESAVSENLYIRLDLFFTFPTWMVVTRHVLHRIAQDIHEG